MVSYNLVFNGHRFKTLTLANIGANSYMLINIKFA